MVIPPALKSRPYLMYWIGHLVSVAGSQMQLWALYWHLRTLSDQPMVISGIGLVRILPVILLSLVAGVAADRFNRRKMVIITQFALASVALMLGLTTSLGATTIWILFGLVGVQSVAAAFDVPARQSLIPSLVPRENLANAYSLNSIAAKVGGILGPAITGVVIAFLGLQWAYWINAISFLAVILALYAMGDFQPVIEEKALKVRGTFHDMPRRYRIHQKLAHHLFGHDPGFLWDFLFFCEHPAALRGNGYPPCWPAPVWLAVGFPIHRHFDGRVISLANIKSSQAGHVDLRFRGRIRSGDNPIWDFNFLLVDHAGVDLDRCL